MRTDVSQGESDMVFVTPEMNNTGKIIVYGDYYRYWLDKEKKIKNPRFNLFSGQVLDLKEKKPAAIDHFYRLVDTMINKDVTICVVPSSDPENTDSGIVKVGEMLAANGRKDKVLYLKRTRKIDKLSHGGNRSKNLHLSTIDVDENMTIEGEVVLLMDDVTTSGNSLKACRDILLKNGASQVEMFAIAKTVEESPETNDQQ